MQEATINLLPKQTEAWEAYEDPLVTELGYGGAAGGGKTRLGWYIGIGISEQQPGSRGAVGRKELKTLRITTLAELWIIFSEMGYKTGRDYSYDAKDSIIKFPNGSEILLLDTAYSPQDPEYTRFGSLNLTWAWVEESNETPEKAISILKTRVGRNNRFKLTDGRQYEVKPFWLETFNPNKGHVHRDYYKPWKEQQLPTYRRFIRALPGDNPYLPKSYIENLRRADKTTRERLLYGNFDYSDDPLKLFQYDAITELLDNSLPERKTPPKLIIADIARFGGDKIVFGLFRGLTLYGLCVYTYQGTDETAKQLRLESVEEGIPYQNILIDEDGIGGGVVDQMRGARGFMGNASPTTYYNEIGGRLSTENFQNFRAQAYFKLAEMVNAHQLAIKITKFKTNIEGYTVEKAISDLFEELDQTKRKDNTAGEKLAVIPKSEIKEQLGRSPDFADVLMMRMFFEFKEPYQEPTEYWPQLPKPIKINKAR